MNWLCPLCLARNMQQSRQNNTATDLLKSSDRGRDGDRDSTARELLQLITDRTPAVSYVTLCPCFCCAVYVYILFGRQTKSETSCSKSTENNNESPSQLSLPFFPKCFIYSVFFFPYQHACIFYLHANPLKLNWKENKEKCLKSSSLSWLHLAESSLKSMQPRYISHREAKKGKGFHCLWETMWSQTRITFFSAVMKLSVFIFLDGSVLLYMVLLGSSGAELWPQGPSEACWWFDVKISAI